MALRYGFIGTLLCILATLVVDEVLGAAGEVKSHQKISDTQGGFTGTLFDVDLFGSAVAPLGDLDGDGALDVAVGAYADEATVNVGANRGAVWVMFLNADGTVKAHQEINQVNGGFTGTLNVHDNFGRSLASLGDLDGDGVVDLAVGAFGDDDPGPIDTGIGRGALWILFLNSNGTVKSHQKISSTQGGFSGVLDFDDRFGVSVASLGDVDGDSIVDLAVGAYLDDDGGSDRGAVWILFLNADWTVKAHQKISDTQGGFTGTMDDADWFGYSVASLGRIDADSVPDLAVGAPQDDDGSSGRGAVWILFLNTDGMVKSHQKISATQGEFSGTLDTGDLLGYSATGLGDVNCDGFGDLAVGAFGDRRWRNVRSQQ